MTVLRAPILLASAVTLAGAITVPAQAQVADEIVLNIMRECAKIDDPTARLACYDNNIRNAGASPRRAVPGAMPTPAGGAGAPVAAGAAQGFGREDVPDPGRFSTPAGEVAAIAAYVADVDQIRPNQYRITLQDGAVWEFTEATSPSYRPPRAGGEVEIERGSLGSFLLQYDNQTGVRVRRVR